MPVDETYRRQVSLLVRILPFVAEENCFSLKGGTAINLFIRNLPRLSVDIDLAFIPVTGRMTSLQKIDTSLRRIESRIRESVPLSRVQRGKLRGEDTVNKLFVRVKDTQVKIEVTPVLRGCVLAPSEREVTKTVEEQFGHAAIQVLSPADLYAGKLVAALHRQHPRDLFDVRELLLNEGIDDQLRTAFLVYLISHHRPIAKLLAPVRRDMTEEFNRGLVNLMENSVTLEELVRVREELVSVIVGAMSEAHRRFLLSFQKGTPEWSLLNVPHAKTLPAVRWQLKKLKQIDEQELTEQTAQLEAVFTREY